MSELAGKSVLDLLWERLDEFMDDLMSVQHLLAAGMGREEKGRAYGMAEAIALITNPYHPNIDAVRADAVERWEQRQGVSDYQEKLVKKMVRAHNERSTELAARREARRARRAARNG